MDAVHPLGIGLLSIGQQIQPAYSESFVIHSIEQYAVVETVEKT